MRLGLGNFASAWRDAGDPAAGRLFISVGGEDGRGEFGGVPDSVAGSGSVARSPEHVRNAGGVGGSGSPRAVPDLWAAQGGSRPVQIFGRVGRTERGFCGQGKWKTRAEWLFRTGCGDYTRVGFERKLHRFYNYFLVATSRSPRMKNNYSKKEIEPRGYYNIYYCYLLVATTFFSTRGQ